MKIFNSYGIVLPEGKVFSRISAWRVSNVEGNSYGSTGSVHGIGDFLDLMGISMGFHRLFIQQFGITLGNQSWLAGTSPMRSSLEICLYIIYIDKYAITYWL